jgi:very-short-patch-repair endonuclease
MDFNYHYNKNLKQFSRKLRKNPTKGEAILWYKLLHKRHMKGYSFLRQRSILNYIVDFFCKEWMVILMKIKLRKIY